MYKLVECGIECMEMLDNLNIPYSRDIHMSVNYRADRRWGRCERTADGFNITISDKLLDERNSINGLKETILHELLHTISGCMNHGEKWKRYAKMVNNAYGHDVKRCNTAEEKGVCDEMIAEMQAKRAMKLASKPTYIVACTKCGHKYIRHKMSKLVSNPDLYLCGTCDGKLIREA